MYWQKLTSECRQDRRYTRHTHCVCQRLYSYDVTGYRTLCRAVFVIDIFLWCVGGKKKSRGVSWDNSELYQPSIKLPDFFKAITETQIWQRRQHIQFHGLPKESVLLIDMKFGVNEILINTILRWVRGGGRSPYMQKEGLHFFAQYIHVGYQIDGSD